MTDMKLTSLLLLSAVFFACSDEDAGQPGPGDDGELVARGQYLAENVTGCPACHSPRDPMGAPIPGQYLSGSECFNRLENGSCLNAPNLTNHETGLLNRTDAEIKRMIKDGLRPAATGEELEIVEFTRKSPLRIQEGGVSMNEIRRRFPSGSFYLVGTPAVTNVARDLGWFDEYWTIDDSSLFRLVRTSLVALWQTSVRNSV